MANKPSAFKFGDFEVREREFSLVKAGEALPVEPKAFLALLFLLRNPQKLIPKEELVKAVWGDTAGWQVARPSAPKTRPEPREAVPRRGTCDLSRRCSCFCGAQRSQQ